MTLQQEKTTIAVMADESGTDYDYRAIEAGAMNHAIPPRALKAFAFDAVTETLTVAQLVDAYFEDQDANRITLDEAAQREQYGAL